MFSLTRRPFTSSFTVRRVNSSTFVVEEDDAFYEHPLIYVKVHPQAPVIVLGDAGCDEPSEAHKQDTYIHLRKFLEECPVKANNNLPLNPGGERQYIIISTHCHFDHTLGLTQFLEGGTTRIVASAAGRDFVESDLGDHGLFDNMHLPTPYYQVTDWADAFERLYYNHKGFDGKLDLGISIIHTPGHTPDELAWYDHEEMHLYVGDSFYEEGEGDNMPIVWPIHGNMVEWAFSMQKLQYFVKSENARAAEKARASVEVDWVEVPKRVLISCGHQTVAVDGEEICQHVEKFWWRVVKGEVPVTKTQVLLGETFDTWRESGKDRAKMHYRAPRRLMDDARKFFKGTGLD